jgi:hypothetical protein
MTQRHSNNGFVRGHCGLSGKEGVIGLCKRHRGFAVNPTSGLSLILLTLPGNTFPSGNRVLWQFIMFKENML